VFQFVLEFESVLEYHQAMCLEFEFGFEFGLVLQQVSLNLESVFEFELV
jgi:hypothetical protein